MNLHGVVGPVVAAVNPTVALSLQRSTGYTTGADFKQVPTYATLTGPGQVQPISQSQLQKIDGLNQQGSYRQVYLYGSWFGQVREGQQGGDMLTLPDGSLWLVVKALENWPDWSGVLVCLQPST